MIRLTELEEARYGDDVDVGALFHKLVLGNKEGYDKDFSQRPTIKGSIKKSTTWSAVHDKWDAIV